MWSCGVILFAMICGYLPFEDQNSSVLYRKILAAQYSIPSFVSPGARNVIEGLLTTEPQQRMTSSKLRQHPWFGLVQPDCFLSRSASAHFHHFEDDVLEELEKFGFPTDHTLRCLRMNKHNAVTTTYHLLAQKKRRVLRQDPREQVSLSGILEADVAAAAASASCAATPRGASITPRDV